MISTKLSTIFIVAREAAQDLLGVMSLGRGRDLRNAGLLVVAFVCAVLPLELSHLLSAAVGAAGYLMLQAMQPQAERADKPVKPPVKRESPSPRSGRPQRSARSTSGGAAGPSPVAREASLDGIRAEVRKPSAMPVVAPTFHACGWDQEVQELLVRLAPTPEADAAVAEIARRVGRVICPMIPEAEVTGFASGNLTSRVAFGVAVPEVDIVISASPAALMARLQGRWAQAGNAGPRAGLRNPESLRNGALRLDARKLQKSAIRACTDRLVGSSAFKFRRSAFRGTEPKVTMIAPSPFSNGHGFPVNISVNAVTPLYNAALITECGQLEPRAKELILLVKRWAKDRGLCHAAKGHFSPYAWTLLAIFFMQAGTEEPMLPPLENFPSSSGLMQRRRLPPSRPGAAVAPCSCRLSAGALFKEFVAFYTNEFNWEKEAVSIRVGKRAPPDVLLPLHIILREDKTTLVGPSIEDPFEDWQNLGECSTAASLQRLHEELRRAQEICSRDEPSLTALLEPWAPPEQADRAEAEVEEQED